MIQYDPGNWSILFAFSLRGSVFPKALAIALPSSILSATLHVVLNFYPEFEPLLSAGDGTTEVLGGFTFILGFLVVFRSQTAYSRWWEGGTLLQQLRGEWFNSFSCLLAFCNAAPEKQDEVRAFQHQLVRLYSLLFGCALQQVCTLDDKRFELICMDGMHPDSMRFLQACPDRCEVVLQWIQRLIVEVDTCEIIKIAPPILSRVFNELGNGIVNLNNARKITEFPIPFPLAQMITVMLLFQAMVTPIVCALLVSTAVSAAGVCFISIFSYWSINYIATELEMPFGNDHNDLPLYYMQQDMNRSLRVLIDDLAQGVPAFLFDEQFHAGLQIQVVDFDGDLIDYSGGLAQHQEARDSGSGSDTDDFSHAASLRRSVVSRHGTSARSSRAYSNSDGGAETPQYMSEGSPKLNDPRPPVSPSAGRSPPGTPKTPVSKSSRGTTQIATEQIPKTPNKARLIQASARGPQDAANSASLGEEEAPVFGTRREEKIRHGRAISFRMAGWEDAVATFETGRATELISETMERSEKTWSRERKQGAPQSPYQELVALAMRMENDLSRIAREMEALARTRRSDGSVKSHAGSNGDGERIEQSM